MMSRKKFGFTLVELMVVAVIVAILAAVAIPLMSANKKRAMSTEAEAALGQMRTALRAMYAETQTYASNYNGQAISTITNIPGMSPSDLDGKYFVSGNYSVSVTPTTYTLTAVGAGQLAGVTITLNQDGNFARSGL